MIGHLIRHDSSTKSVIEGNVEGYIGRTRMEYMKQIMIEIEKDSYKNCKN